MNTENVQKLVTALRSGKYTQAKGALRKGDSFCCLGVACDISGLGKWETDPRSYVDNVGGDRYVVRNNVGQKIGSDTSVLPRPVAVWLGMEIGGAFEIPVSRDGINERDEDEDRETGTHYALTELNDNGLTFSQIADILENAHVFDWENGPNPEYMPVEEDDEVSQADVDF